MRHRLTRGHLVRRRVLARYLATTDEPRLQVGTGTEPLPGWLDSDIVSGDIHLDLTRPLPIPSGTFAYVFSEHVIEHLPEASIPTHLAELRRILRPGGVARISTPDLPRLMALYEDGNPDASLEEYRRVVSVGTGRPHVRACEVFNTAVRGWGHQYIYDEEDLSARLIDAGFSSAERRDVGQSEHDALRGIDRRADAVGRAETLCIEAVA
jgi:predicted SAM-dependent methyltransferase